MNAINEEVISYYLFSTVELRASIAKFTGMSCAIVRQACRYRNLESFCRLCAGLGLGAVA